jgi:hypothetical protein
MSDPFFSKIKTEYWQSRFVKNSVSNRLDLNNIHIFVIIFKLITFKLKGFFLTYKVQVLAS